MAHSLLYVDALAGRRTEVEIWDWLYGWGSCLFKAASYLSPLKPPKKTQKILKWPLISSAWGGGPEELKENAFLFLDGKYSLAERLSWINQFSPVWSIIWVKGNNLSSVPFRPGARLGVSGSFSSSSCASGSPRHHLQMAGPFPLGEKKWKPAGLAPGKIKGAILSKAVQPVVAVQVPPSSGLHPAPFTLSKDSLLRKALNVHLPFWCVRCLRALAFEPRLRKNEFQASKWLKTGTSLAVQWLRLHVPNSGGTGSNPGQGTKILRAAWCG